MDEDVVEDEDVSHSSPSLAAGTSAAAAATNEERPIQVDEHEMKPPAAGGRMQFFKSKVTSTLEFINRSVGYLGHWTKPY